MIADWLKWQDSIEASVFVTATASNLVLNMIRKPDYDCFEHLYLWFIAQAQEIRMSKYSLDILTGRFVENSPCVLHIIRISHST